MPPPVRPAIPLVPGTGLDPRPAALAAAEPLAGAVCIPLAELPLRTHELPAPGETIEVVASRPEDRDARAACDWLNSHGRRAVVRAVRPAEGAGGAVGRAGRLWSPNPCVLELAARRPAGRALDLACGAGRDAVYLASAGWDVLGVDVLPDALARAAALAAGCLPASHRPRWRVMDLESGRPEFAAGHFDLITSFRYLHRPLLARLAEWLAPGGSVLIVTFTEAHRRRHGKPARDDHVLRSGELPALLSGLRIDYFRELWRGDAHFAELHALRD